MATDKQVVVLSKHILQIESFVKANTANYHRDLDAYIELSGRRADNMMDMINANKDALNNTWQAVRKIHESMRSTKNQQWQLMNVVVRLSAATTHILKDSLQAIKKLDEVWTRFCY